MQIIALSKEVSISIKFNGLGNFQCLDDYNIDIVFLFSDTTHVASFLHLWCIFFSWTNKWKKSSHRIYFLFPYCFANLRNISLNKTLNNFILLWNSNKIILIEISAVSHPGLHSCQLLLCEGQYFEYIYTGKGKKLRKFYPPGTH